MYYIDHGEKTFTIYKRNLNNLKDQIFLGKGISMPQSDIYDNFLWAGGDLYYSTRVPWKIHKYSEGKSVLINSTKNNCVSDIVEYKGQAYFVISDGDDTYRIKKYSSKDNAVFEVAELKDYYGGLRMVNGYAYYYGKDYKNQYIKLNE